ncbi:hypothetical protein LTS08_001140 [Lithohypha guttulata]|nr:hypothetical protein LTS08_001140 [Lithohypha guttulata]
MASTTRASAQSSTKQVILFADGDGFVFLTTLAVTASSKVMLVRSLKNNKLYVRKESFARDYREVYDVQTPDVRNLWNVRHVDGTITLVGWTEYLDQMSATVICVSYWKFYNANTLHHLQQTLRTSRQPLPEQCLWSICLRMFKTMLDALRAGVVHMDAHAGNWFLNLKEGSTEPGFVLGDWGQAEIFPRDETNNTGIERFWYQAHRKLTTSLVEPVRSLLPRKTPLGGTLRSYFDRVLGRHQGTGNGQPLFLIEALNNIEDTKPSMFATGEAWLESVQKIYNRIESARPSPGSTRSSADTYRHMLTDHATALPSYDEAYVQLEELASEIGNSSTNLVNVVPPWKEAHIDTSSTPPRIVSIQHPATSFSGNNYQDDTKREYLPRAWDEAHQRMKRLVIELAGEEEVNEYNENFGLQGESETMGRINTAF